MSTTMNTNMSSLTLQLFAGIGINFQQKYADTRYKPMDLLTCEVIGFQKQFGPIL